MYAERSTPKPIYFNELACDGQATFSPQKYVKKFWGLMSSVHHSLPRLLFGNYFC